MKKETPRIFLHPGYVKSKNDGDVHFITAKQLATLYCVDINKCHVVYEGDPAIIPQYDDRHLYPRYDGDYPIFRREI